jgi:bacterioferritin-associated ferredoxin
VYACVCHAVTEATVQNCHSAGLRNVRQVSAATRAGSNCGQCVRRLRAMLSSTAAHQSSPAAASVVTSTVVTNIAEASAAATSTAQTTDAAAVDDSRTETAA